MNDLQFAYSATKKVLRIYVCKNGRISFAAIDADKKAKKRVITKARASEIAEANGIKLDDYVKLSRIFRMVDDDGKITFPDQFTAIVRLEEFLPAFFINGKDNENPEYLLADNSDGDKMSIFDNGLTLDVCGFKFDAVFDIDEKTYIKELQDNEMSEILNIEGKSGRNYIFEAKTYKLIDTLGGKNLCDTNDEEEYEADAESDPPPVVVDKPKETRSKLLDIILAHRNEHNNLCKNQ